MPSPDLPRLHAVTDSATLDSSEFVRRAISIMEAAGARLALHLRGPASSGRSLYEMAMALGPAARSTGALLVANDRVDVALAAGLGGAHLGERSLAVRDVRALLGPDRLIGASVHDEAALRTALDDGANYAFVGNVYETMSHPGRAGLGEGGLARIVEHVPGLAVIAIGGLTPDRVGEARRAGAFGVAVLRGVWSAGDPAAAVLDYLAALERPSTESP